MRRAAKVDANQSAIVQALRQAGVSVEPLHFAGRGVPDLLCARAGVNYLLEVKSPGGELTDDEARWHAEWRGQVAVVESVDDALRALGLAAPDGDVALAEQSRTFTMDFWNDLDRMDGRRTAPCPMCGMPGLEVRTTIRRGKRWFYVLHCRSVQPLGVPGAA